MSFRMKQATPNQSIKVAARMGNHMNIHIIVLSALDDDAILAGQELAVSRQMKVFQLWHKGAFVFPIFERIDLCQNLLRDPVSQGRGFV